MAKHKFDIKAYSIPIALGVLSVGTMVLTFNENSKISELESDISTLEELKADAESAALTLDAPFDKEEHKEELEARTVTAKAIGAEIIAMDDKLTAFYKTNEPLPEDEAEKEKLFAELADAQLENVRLTGAGEADHINTWKLNPEWTTTLETVLTYQDSPTVPILFSLTTKDGRNAGVIYAVYDTVNDKLLNVSKYYTTVGMQDAVDVGGI